MRDKGELRFGNSAEDGNDYIIANVRANKDKVVLFYDEDGGARCRLYPPAFETAFQPR